MAGKPSALKNKLFITYAAMIAFVVCLFTVFLVFVTSAQNRRTELYHQRELFGNNLAEIESTLWQMDRLAMQVASDNEILNLFITLGTDGDGGNYFSTDLIDFIRISSLLSSINGTDQYAARISVYNRSGDYVSTGALYETPGAVAASLADTRVYDETVSAVQASSESRRVSGFSADRRSNNPSVRLVSLQRALASFSGTVYGLVDVQTTAEAFSRHGFWNLSGQTALLTDAKGNVVYPLDAGERLQAELIEIYAEAEAEPAAPEGFFTFHREVGGDDCVVLAAKVYLSDWLFVRILPTASLVAPYLGNYWMMALAGAALLCLLVAAVYYAAFRIARPLRTLATALSDVNLSNMREAIAETRAEHATEELTALSGAYRTMLSRLDQSIAMEIQAHLRALQSQMNPHFLYNMLSVIIESGEEESAPRTVSMCMKLSSMLRYIADYNGDSASLADEIAHARNYLDLMKERYEDHFVYEIETEGPMESIAVPKMILQPLVENCFAHGFKNIRPPWRIRVAVHARGNRWALQVFDNGGGVTEETVRALRARVDAYSADMTAGYHQLRLGGMGLINTMVRLRLHRGEGSAFSIENRPEGGTVVSIEGVSI